MNVQKTALQIQKTLDFFYASGSFLPAIEDTIYLNLQQKEKIRNKFFDGEMKIELPLIYKQGLKFLNCRDQIIHFLWEQKNKLKIEEKSLDELYRYLIHDKGILYSIYHNLKVDMNIPERRYFFIKLIWMDGDFEIDQNTIIKIIKLSEESKSPKLTKQAQKIMQGFNVTKKSIDSCLTIMSQIQNFKSHIDLADSLVLSVHPLDFILMGCNDYNWQTCTEPHREYFSTALGACTDSSTIIAYIKSGKSKLLIDSDKTTWDNKKTRRMIHINDSFTGAILNKNYPVECVSKLKTIELFLKNKMNLEGEEIETSHINNFFIDYPQIMYLDFINSLLVNFIGEKKSYFIGEVCYCLSCGIDYDEIYDDRGGYGFCLDCDYHNL